MNTTKFISIICFLWLSVSGCSTATRVTAHNNDNQVPDYQNTVDEIECVNLNKCSLLEEYVNALGQNCRTVQTQDGDFHKYCKSLVNSGYWEHIRVL